MSGLGTRGRLIAAFSALAAALAAAFGLQLVRLNRMEKGIGELRDHQEEMHFALELEGAVRSEYARQGRVLAGEEAAPPGGGGGDETIARLVRELSARVDEPRSSGWVARIAAATRALDARFRAELADLEASRPRPPDAEQARFALVFEVEEGVDQLFAVLQEESVAQASAVEALRRESRRLAVAFAIALPLFALVVVFYLARSIARPLSVLGAGAARIAAGDLDTRIALRGPNEFAALAAEFNEMAAALRQHQEELLRSEKLASLGRLAAGVAHELNNPLQVMLGYLTLHRGRFGGEVGTHLARVEREATRCKEIVEALLQLSRPTEVAPARPVDLREVSEEVAEGLRLAMPGAPSLDVSGHAVALGSPARFHQVILNLVKNAAEAAGPSGRVVIEVCRNDATATAHVIVSDTGPGIPAELRDRVFEPFFTTKATGTGLGLALARAIAQAHGGDVELETDDRGEGGARFVLRAPGFSGGTWT